MTNPKRQGLNSAIPDGSDPRNVLRWYPGQGAGRYSPLWDVNLTQWSQAALAGGQNLRQNDVGNVLNLAAKAEVAGFNATAPGTTFGASGFIVVCPIVSFGP